MKPKLFLIYLCCLLIPAIPISGQKKKSNTSSQQEGSRKKSKGKKGSKEDEESIDNFRKSRKGKGSKEKKQDTRAMLAAAGGTHKKQSTYQSKAIYYGGRTYTASIEQVNGYRICIYTGSNRQDALKTKTAFSTYYRNVRSFMSYNLPYYKIKVGNYEDKKAAAKALKEFQTQFPAAFISPDMVTIVRRTLYVKPPPTQEYNNTDMNLQASNTEAVKKPKKKKRKPLADVAKPAEEI